MKKYLTLLSLFLLVAAELFWGRELRSFDYLRSADTLLSPYALPILALCCVYFLIYFRTDDQAKHNWERFLEDTPDAKWSVVVVIAIVLFGTFLRFWKLDSLFEGMTYDESYKGLDAIAIRYFGERPVFLDWNGGREALVAYLVAAAQKLFGFSILSIRFFPALSASLTLVFFYLFVRKIFNNNLALLSLFLLTVSKYHIIHSRYGVRAGLYTFFEVVVLYLVAPSRGVEKHRTRQLLLAGILAGLGFYTYIAYRIFPVVLIAFFLQSGVRNNLRKHGKPFLAACALCILVTIPLATYYMQHFDRFADRMKRTEVFNQKIKGKSVAPAELLMASAKNTFEMFNLRGDFIARHNVNGEPMLSSYAAPFFLLGLFLALANIRKPYAFFVLLYFLVGLLPGILSVGAPNTPRTLGSLPPVFLFVSFGILAAVQIIAGVSAFLARLFLAIILAGNLITGIRDALFRFPQFLDSLPDRAAETWGMDRDPTNVATLLNNLGNHCEGYVSPQFFFHSTVEYLTYSESRHKLFTKNTDLRRTTAKGLVAVVILQPHDMNLWWLRDDSGKNFYKWWEQNYKMGAAKIHSLVGQTYNAEMFLTKGTDAPLLEELKQRYPKGKVLNYGKFSAFVVAP